MKEAAEKVLENDNDTLYEDYDVSRDKGEEVKKGEIKNLAKKEDC